MNFEEIKKEVEKRLSEKRFLHSCGVAKRAQELARIYGEDEEKAKMIGIAHDIAKEMPKEEALSYIKENGITFDEIEKQQPELWHSKIGADICQKKFGFTNDMKQAILYHTTGHVDMNRMDKIIYIADKTEENRKYRFMDLEEAMYISNQDLDDGILYIAGVGIKMNIDKKTLIHPDTIHVMNQILCAKKNSKEE